MLFLMSMFGWLVLTIILKWCTFFTDGANPPQLLQVRCFLVYPVTAMRWCLHVIPVSVTSAWSFAAPLQPFVVCRD